MSAATRNPRVDRNNPLYLAWRRFLKSKPGVISGIVLIVLYTVALFAGFLAPYNLITQHPESVYQPPQRVRLFHEGQLRRPFVYQVKKERDPVTFINSYQEDKTRPTPIRFLIAQGEPYSFLGLKTNLHLFGVAQAEGNYFPLGTDQFGRCLFSRTLVGSQVSLTVGVIGVFISFVIGILLGGISGFFAGRSFKVAPPVVGALGPPNQRLLWGLVLVALLVGWSLLMWGAFRSMDAIPNSTTSKVLIALFYLVGLAALGFAALRGIKIDPDNVIQRVVEVLLSIPRLPILMALSTVIPASWPSSYVYLGIIAVLSFIGWAGLARVVRGQVLAAREVDYVTAALALGSSNLRVILRHITPNLTSYLIVTATLALPGYIIGESALSFLGLGIKEPMASWGLLLRDAQNFQSLNLYPWLLTPGILIFVSVLAYNFLGDALRDAADVRSVD